MSCHQMRPGLILTSLCLLLSKSSVLGCEDISPDVLLDCEELVLMSPKMCVEDFMVREAYCDRSCGRPPCPAKALDVSVGPDVVFEAKKTGQAHSPLEPTIFQSNEQVPPIPVASEKSEESLTVSKPDQVEQALQEEKILFPGATEPQADAQVTEAPGTFRGMTEPKAADIETLLNDKDSICKTPAEFLELREDLSLFRKASQRFGLWSTFLSHYFFATVFIPNNEAFRKVFEVLLVSEEDFLNGDESIILQLLQVHVVPGQNTFIGSLFDGQKLPTLLSATQELAIEQSQIVSPGGPRATIIEGDLVFCNTVLHIIDGVFAPAPLVEMQKSLQD